MEKNNSKEKQYEIKSKRKNKKKRHILRNIILTLFILSFLGVLSGIGIFAGIFFSDKWEITKNDLIASENTEVVDNKNNKIAVLSVTDGSENRKIIPLSQMGKYTTNAYVAIEDKRFYEHSGVDILRTAKATFSYILNKGSSDVGGGSTITQQLVKNLMKDKADTGSAGVERKIREMSRAYQIEKMLDKNQIIEKYLNVIFIGGNELHGIEYGARYYFDKSAKDLDLAESAFLAGINNAPNMYDPYDRKNDHSELIKNRTKLVLYFMKEQNRISNNIEEAEKLYKEAVDKVEKGLTFKKGKFEFGNMTYFVSEAVKEAAKDLAKKKDIDYNEAESMIRTGGYKLYTTQDTRIQNIILKEMSRDIYGEKRKENGVTDHTEVGMAIIDHKTGRVVGIGGALNSNQGTNLNYAVDAHRQTGSAMKPLANIAPGLEEKVITASTIYSDRKTDFRGLQPNNAYGFAGYGDTLSARKAITVSSNIVNIKIFSNIGPNTVIDYLHEFGLDSYNKTDDSVLTLAIGGATHGSSPLEMAAAYATLANKGEYIEPTFYEKLINSNGQTVVESKQEKRRVISEANAFIVSDILKDVTTQPGGTARACAISGMDVAAKTGTTDNSADKWLCGYTPYYAASTWYGYSDKVWGVNDINTSKNIWANVMSKVHSNLKGKRFSKPDGVITAKVCKLSGKLATKDCKSTYTEYFTKGNMPKECDGHVKIKICKQSKKVATPYCTDIEEKIYTAKPDKEANAWWKEIGKDRYKIPTEICYMHTEETSKITIADVLGKTKEEAISLLKGLTLNVIEGHDSSKPNGIVLKQSLQAGIKVEKGVNITITVNKIDEIKPNEENTEKPENNNIEENVNNTEENENNTEDDENNIEENMNDIDKNITNDQKQ